MVLFLLTQPFILDDVIYTVMNVPVLGILVTHLKFKNVCVLSYNNTDCHLGIKLMFFLCLEETGGSILGSKHLEFTELFAEDGSMKSDKELKASKYSFTLLNFAYL